MKKEKTEDLTEEISKIANPTETMKAMKVRDVIKAPNAQRVSFNGIKQRLKDDESTSKRIYKFERLDKYFTIKRTK